MAENDQVEEYAKACIEYDELKAEIARLRALNKELWDDCEWCETPGMGPGPTWAISDEIAKKISPIADEGAGRR